VTGETITYQYDSLKRLVNAYNAAAPPANPPLWSDAYSYDGFGNLTGMIGSGGAPSLSVSVNAATNQISPTNILYDGNGNVTQFGPSGSLTTMAYNVANRMATVNSTNAYAYDPAGQRVYSRNSAGVETLYVYGTGGKKLATYTIASITGNTQVNFTMQSRNVYFSGKLISAEGNAVAVDRLGSVRWNAASGGHTYYPYGVEYSATTNDTEKYATYTRDTLTGLDYAKNRYYSSTWGRFMAPDPSHASMHLQTPLSWNRYTYTLGDPIGGNDPRGLDSDDDGDDGCPDGQMCFFGGGSGGGSSAGWGGGGDGDGSVVTDTPSGSGYINTSPGAGIPVVSSTFTPAGEDPTAPLANGDVPIWGSNGGNGTAILAGTGELLGSASVGAFGYTPVASVDIGPASFEGLVIGQYDSNTGASVSTMTEFGLGPTSVGYRGGHNEQLVRRLHLHQYDPAR
jgi:RHS repeat-associated protein